MNPNQLANLISNDKSVRDALNLLNDLPDKANRTLFVVDGNGALEGVLTDGDIRRGLLKGLSLDDKLTPCMNTSYRFLLEGKYTMQDIKDLRDAEIKNVPLLNEKRQIRKFLDLQHHYSLLPVHAVLMAGGRGERLRPLTDTVPKPMLKVGAKPIIEHNIDRLAKFGIDHISLSIRYLGEQLVDYFKDGSAKGIHINYVTETDPLGTIGALSLIEKFHEEDLLVMNSDLLTNINFEDFYESFKKSDAAISVATFPFQVKVPFALLETEADAIVSLKEKPILTYQCNAGIYLIKRSMLEYIPHNTFYNTPDLIELAISKNMKVSYFPILGYWLDIGSKDDFQKAQNDIQHLKID